MIFHLQVGNKNHVPTDEDLKRVIAEFNKELPVFDIPVQVSEVYKGPLLERLVIQCGSPRWSPTPEEVEALRKQFAEAKEGDVVATRHDVKVSLIPVYVPQTGVAA